MTKTIIEQVIEDKRYFAYSKIARNEVKIGAEKALRLFAKEIEKQFGESVDYTDDKHTYYLQKFNWEKLKKQEGLNKRIDQDRIIKGKKK